MSKVTKPNAGVKHLDSHLLQTFILQSFLKGNTKKIKYQAIADKNSPYRLA